MTGHLDHLRVARLPCGVLALLLLTAWSASVGAQSAGDSGLQSAPPEASQSVPEASPSDGDPQVKEAREHFNRGVAFYSDGDTDAAQLEFERAYELHPSYRLLFNPAQVSAERLDYLKAEGYFRRYLTEGGDDIEPERRQQVEKELERLGLERRSAWNVREFADFSGCAGVQVSAQAYCMYFKRARDPCAPEKSAKSCAFQAVRRSRVEADVSARARPVQARSPQAGYGP